MYFGPTKVHIAKMQKWQLLCKGIDFRIQTNFSYID